MMSGIRGTNTSPEIAVRKHLFASGFRYRLHDRNLPGRPDIVLSHLRSAVFVHGCFWHRHSRCKYSYNPKSNVAFWKEKFLSNVTRDRQVRKQLRHSGWRVHVIWECEVNESGLARLVRSLRDRT
jgi:DNA mismatch endonuclease (patch repair protein)